MPPIVFFDRYTGQTRVEEVYGDAALKWTYQTVAGRASLHALVKRAIFSRWYGWRMDDPRTKEKVLPFIEQYGLDADEFLRRPDQFETFNEFFYRELKPSARPIDADPRSAVFPADGRHLCVPDLSRCNGLFVKGKMFDLGQLLGSESLADRYRQGSLLLSRLCPTDYHRFHFPVSGTPSATRSIDGPLFSVNPIALRRNIEILATNKRTITTLTSDDFGDVLCIEVGATCVGGICQTFTPGQSVAKGDEKGYFRFGGSSTIMVFEAGRIAFADDLIEQSSEHRELYGRMGDTMARKMDRE